MTEPIKPSDLVDAKTKAIPEPVFRIVNELITKHYINGSARVFQKDIVHEIENQVICKRSQIFDEGWLNFEAVYVAAGWRVTYEKPGYNESGDAFFLFEAI